MFCSVLHLNQATRFSHMLLAPMCSTPPVICSRSPISTAAPSGRSSSPVKRKLGICFSVNPVLQACQDQEESSTKPSERLHQYHTAGSRPVCGFITFRGIGSSSSQHSTNRERHFEINRMTVPTDEDRARCGSVRKASYGNFKEKVAGRDSFQTVSLDERVMERGVKTETIDGVNRSMQQLDATSLPPIDGKIGTNGIAIKTCDEAPKAPLPFAGIIGTIASSTFFSLSIVCVKLMPESDSLAEKIKAVWFRGVFIAIMCAITMFARGTTFKIAKDERWLMFSRTTIGFFGSLGGFTSIHYITLGESTALVYLSIVWTTALGYFVLREPFPLTLIFAIPLAMLGIILIAHPDMLLGESTIQAEVLTEVVRHHHQHLIANKGLIGYEDAFNQSIMVGRNSLQGRLADMVANMSSNAILSTDLIEVDPDTETQIYFDQRWPGILIATATSLVLSVVTIILKYRKSTPILTCTFYLGVGIVLMSSVIQLFIGFGKWPDTYSEWLVLLAMGFFSCCGQALMQWALQYEKASILGVVRTVELVLAFCFGSLILDEDVLWTSLLGGFMIILIVVILVLNDRLEKIFCSRCKK